MTVRTVTPTTSTRAGAGSGLYRSSMPALASPPGTPTYTTPSSSTIDVDTPARRSPIRSTIATTTTVTQNSANVATAGACMLLLPLHYTRDPESVLISSALIWSAQPDR